MKIHVHPDLEKVMPEITYVFRVLEKNKSCSIDLHLSASNEFPLIAALPGANIEVSAAFASRELSVSKLDRGGMLPLESGDPDLTGTAFFYLSCLQEYQAEQPDKFGRFTYKESVQSKFDSSCRNIVQECIDKLARQLGIAEAHVKSSFFLSHDIDSVYGAIFEDGFNVLKKGRFDLFLKMLFNVAIGKPDWLNIDQIMKIEDGYNCRSTFYWIVNKGKVGPGLENADYDFRSNGIQKQFNAVKKNGFENGLHKSISKETFSSELSKLGSSPIGNRYHYLKFNLPQGFHAIEESGLKFDSSLGFSEQWGFRNNYGLPVNPFDFSTRKPYAFVEAPLHIMDRTFFNRRMPVAEVEKEIFQFFESHRNDCVLSVLWHNNFFTSYKYKGYLSLYKKILAYIKEGNFATLTQEEMIKKYALRWP